MQQLPVHHRHFSAISGRFGLARRQERGGANFFSVRFLLFSSYRQRNLRHQAAKPAEKQAPARFA
jgi:hypothetical protein